MRRLSRLRRVRHRLRRSESRPLRDAADLRATPNLHGRLPEIAKRSTDLSNRLLPRPARVPYHGECSEAGSRARRLMPSARRARSASRACVSTFQSWLRMQSKNNDAPPVVAKAQILAREGAVRSATGTHSDRLSANGPAGAPPMARVAALTAQYRSLDSCVQKYRIFILTPVIRWALGLVKRFRKRFPMRGFTRGGFSPAAVAHGSIHMKAATELDTRRSADVTLRRGRADDAAACGTICYEGFKAIAEQHNFPPDFPSREVAIDLMTSLLSNPDVRSTVSESNGCVVGSNFVWKYMPVAAIGPITVDPTFQNASVGRRLMQDALEFARESYFPTVRLVQAAYHGRSLSLYTKLGFVVREPLVTLQGEALGISLPGHAVRPAGNADIEAYNRLCVSVHGHPRALELRDAIAQGTATVVERSQRITGYATSIGFFAHAVAESNDDLKALIGAAPHISGPGFLLPARNAELFSWCLERGLRVVQPMTLMSTGLYNAPAGAFLPSILY